MPKDRIVYAILMGLLATAVAASESGLLSSRLAAFAGLFVAGVSGILRVLWPVPPIGELKK